MAEIAPLTPLRYDLARLPHGLATVICPPYDVISPAEREGLVARDPHNVVRLELPEGDGDSKYANAASLLAAWRKEGVLVRAEEPGFYRYDQTFVPPGAGAGARPITRSGFLGLVRLVPFSDRVVLPHERTLSGPKEDRLKLFRATQASPSPGFQLYRDPKKVLDAALATGVTLAEIDTEDGIHHVLAKVSNRDAVRAIVEHLAGSSLLIADGHHRYETALRYAEEASQQPGARPRGAHRYFMTFLANGDDPDLVVFATHRHLHDAWDGKVPLDLLETKTKGLFRTRRLDASVAHDAAALLRELAAAGRTAPSLVAVTVDGALLMTLDPSADLAAHPVLGKENAALRKTDVALLHMGILEPILGISKEKQAAKTHIWYPQDASAAIADLLGGPPEKKGNALFLMNATPVADVREVAEAGEVMPQKSTFFYPKVPTGLVLHTLEADRDVAST